MQFPVRRKLWLAVGIAVVVLAVAVVAFGHWALGQAEAKVRAQLDRRLADSGFGVAWGSFAASWGGTVTVDDVVLREGGVTLATVQRLQASVSWWALLRGQRRLSWVTVQRPVLTADVLDGKPLAWLRLADALRKNRDPTEPTVHKSLADRLGTLSVREGKVALAVLGKAVWLTGPALQVSDVNMELDTGEAGTLSLRMPDRLGAGTLQVTLRCDQGELAGLVGAFTPAARYVPPEVSRERLPKDLVAEVNGLAWQRGAPPELLRAVILAQPTVAAQPALLEIERTSWADGALTAHDLAVHVPKARWLGAAQRWSADHPAALPAEWTVVAAGLGDVHGRVLSVHLAKDASVTVIAAHKAELRSAGTRAGFDQLTVRVPPKSTTGDGLAAEVKVARPFVELPRRLLPDSKFQLLVDELLAIRKVPDQLPEPDDDGDADATDVPPKPEPDLGAPAQVAPLVQPARTKPIGAEAAKDRPPVKIARQIKEFHAKLLGLRDKVAHAWPLEKWPVALSVRIEHGAAALLGEDGAALVGVRGVGFAVDGPDGAGAGVWAAAEPFDRKGSWGRAGLRWRKRGQTYHLDVQLQGAGVAQVLGARTSGLSVADNADLDLAVAIDFKPDRTLTVAGHADVQHMGIAWWRLADRPIADFAANAVFELQVGLTSLVLRTPEVRIGDALQHGSIALTNLDGNPRLSLRLQAPMQDCDAMLSAIPPSLLPTIGKIDAHGLLDWKLGLDVSFPNVGAVAVDLALGDTYCTVDKLGNVDFDEFKRRDWTRPVNENGKILHDVQIGPGSGSWTSTMNMPGYVHYVMWATEDPFLKHRGISEELLAKAIAIDLMTGRFTYGGSTITQQLVKNLYLKRTKALSRKFEEMLIVWQMEKALGKARILEIYVNGVEFGPRIYGVTRAAWEFYQKTPAQLRPKEAVYLAIIKPSPRSGWGTMRGNGWGDWYETKVGKYMDKLLRDNSITPEQYEADKPWKPAFNPAPRGGKQGQKKGK